MIGDLFCDKLCTPTEIKQMSFSELKYWHSWRQVNENSLDEHNKKIAAELAASNC